MKSRLRMTFCFNYYGSHRQLHFRIIKWLIAHQKTVERPGKTVTLTRYDDQRNLTAQFTVRRYTKFRRRKGYFLLVSQMAQLYILKRQWSGNDS